MHSDTLESLLVTTHRLARVAAQATGSRTPAAVWRTLSILEADGPMRIGELAAASRITQPGMTRIIATMVEEEFILRVADVEDSRAWLIKPTAKGISAVNIWRAHLTKTLEPWFGDLTETEWKTLAQAAKILEARTAADAAIA